MDREIYLDNSATTKPYSEVVEIMVQMLTDNYGNPSSLHTKGVDAEMVVKSARGSIAEALNVKNNEIYFTSGGTEANNLAIIGCALANKRRGHHLITTAIEHPSVLNSFQHLEQNGFRTSYIGVDSYGRIDLEQLENAICPDTILVSTMHVNNEVGTIQPLEEVRNILNSKQSNAIYHVDAVQSFGKIRFTPEQLGIDILSMSSHKIHGPKGVGALYAKRGILIAPILFGGNQETGIRSGTENVPGITGFGKAVEITFKDIDEHISHIYNIRKNFEAKLSKSVHNILINGRDQGHRAPHISNVSFLGVKAEVLLHALEAKNIFVSTGSACSSNKPSPSHVLTAMKVDRQLIDSAIRFSFSLYNSEDDIDKCISELTAIVQQLRRFKRR